MKFFNCTTLALNIILTNTLLASDIEPKNSLIFEQNFHPLEIIASYVSPKDIGKLAQTSKNNRDLFSNNENSIGSCHRKNSRFSVRDINENVYYLEEYLSQRVRAPFYAINDRHILAREKPTDYIKLVLKSLLHPQESIPNNLESLYQEKFEIELLLKSLPTNKTAQEKLADFLADMLIWDKTLVQVRALFETQIEAQVEAQVVAQVKHYVVGGYWDNVWDQAVDQVWDVAIDETWDHVWSQNVTQIVNQFETHVVDQISEEVTDYLSNFDLASSLREGILIETLKKEIQSIYMVYQLASISMMYSKEYRDSLNDQENRIIPIIKKNITEVQARNILESIILPEASNEHYLIKNQLDILRRHLPNQS